MSNSSFYADSEAPIVILSAKKHFDELTTDDAKLYAHYLSRASHYGTRAVLRSVSPESENIYDLILTIHDVLNKPATNEDYIEVIGKKLPDSSEIVTLYLEYASQFLSNLGNYKSFGDKKFIPKLTEEQFDKLISEGIANTKVTELYKSVREALFSTEAALLGWPANGHASGYYPGSIAITQEEAEDVNKALAAKGIMPENTRVEKKADKEFIVHVASAETTNKTDYYPKEVFTSDNGAQISFKFGDHSEDFVKIVDSLAEAKKHVANETQSKLLEYYIESFKTGSMNAHKKSQIEWVKDLKPEVESNIGFIETYRDPAGIRGEWEGLVAMVNHDRTAKFSALVDNATHFIADLPWDKVYEKDTFTPPDFTSLEVLTFAGSGVPAGINIPNYDDVRLNFGFKNVSLGNVLSANPKKPKKEEEITFIDPSLQEKFIKWRDDAFEVQVGLHELLGHGTGKLLQETAPGVFNFDKEKVQPKTWYKSTETWSSLFGTTSGSFEECRAELVALYLILKKPLEVLPIFGLTEATDQKDVKFIATLLMARAGLLGLEFWDPKSKKWGQPHMQARFGIFKVLHKAGVVSLKYTDEKTFDDLEIVVDESKLDDVAVEALGDFLSHLALYKSTANVTEGLPYYHGKTEVTEDYGRFRDTVLNKKKPRRHLIQANTFVSSDGTVEVREYEESEVGMIQSFYERAV
ncbi:dipeptidyl-peptidase [Scheffersomyces xylosifermentans]|uniref:dipeptidyl-peptidase n=1 Tax=Scheffersomyces xylosifermentans TaxID=1304137 RepID=UPI00315D63D0